MAKININGVTREMTEEEIAEMQELVIPEVDNDIDKKLERIETGLNKILSLLESK